MVKEGIVLGHKISKKGIEVDKAKIDVIAKLPHPTTVKGIRVFFPRIMPVFTGASYQDFFLKKYPTNDHLLEKNTPIIFSDDCIRAFQTLKDRLTEAPILIAPKLGPSIELMCDASDFAIVYAFEKFRSYLHHEQKHMHTTSFRPYYSSLQKRIQGKILLPMGFLLLQEFDFKVIDTKGAENLAPIMLSDWKTV
ncbi:reverse transcriptase domain-containing protein [Tanacetum coccineum]